MLKPLLAASVLLAGHVVATPALAQEADTVVATVNGEAIKDARELSRKIATFAPGTKTTITVFREGKSRDVTFEVGRQPAA